VGKSAPAVGQAAISRLSDVFKSLADEHRLRILFMLAERGELNVSAIGADLGQSQPAVSHHLTQLRKAGLVDFRRDGKFNFYFLHAGGLDGLIDDLFPAGSPPRLALGALEIGFKKK
jgi:ArsR family transcriptional regulator, arsenate/arsenite/antimonite-responsive transcriptional repressor